MTVPSSVDDCTMPFISCNIVALSTIKKRSRRDRSGTGFFVSLWKLSGGENRQRGLLGLAALDEDIPADAAQEQK